MSMQMLNGLYLYFIEITEPHQIGSLIFNMGGEGDLTT